MSLGLGVGASESPPQARDH